MKIAQLVVEGEDIKKIGDVLYSHKNEHYVGTPYMYRHGDILVLMREAYYMRIGSTLMSVIIIKFVDNNRVEIELVVSGGKEGLLMHSWGSEKSENRNIVHEIMNICESNSWNIISVEPEELIDTFFKSSINKLKEKISKSFKK